LVSLLIIGCNNNLDKTELSEMKTVDYVDIERFMNDWYVIANIPTFIEKGAT
jgi:Bacterial lipocalin